MLIALICSPQCQSRPPKEPERPNEEAKAHLESMPGCLTHLGAAPTFLRHAGCNALLLVSARQQSSHIQADSALRTGARRGTRKDPCLLYPSDAAEQPLR